MIKEPAVLILGAGASMDYGFPSGAELLDDLVNFVSPDGFSRDLIPWETRSEERLHLLAFANTYSGSDIPWSNYKVSLEEVHQFREELIFAAPSSIDDFLYHRSGFEKIGKLCIALCLSSYEKKGPEFLTEKIDMSTVSRHRDVANTSHKGLKIRRGWYSHFWRRLYENTEGKPNAVHDPIETIKTSLKNLTIITFNYDRSLEHFLFNAIKSLYGKDDVETSAILSNLTIHHVHGQLGYLPGFSEPAETATLSERPYQNLYQNLKLGQRTTDSAGWAQYQGWREIYTENR